MPCMYVTHHSRSGGITPCGDCLDVDIAILVFVEDDAQRTLELDYPIVNAGRTGRSGPSQEVVVIGHGQGGGRSGRADAVTTDGDRRSKGRRRCGDQGQNYGDKDGSHFYLNVCYSVSLYARVMLVYVSELEYLVPSRAGMKQCTDAKVSLSGTSLSWFDELVVNSGCFRETSNL